MKIPLDENLPHDLRAWLDEHEVYTVTYLGWSGIRNGHLLRRAAESGFFALVTQDRGMEFEQNLDRLPLALVIVFAPSNDPDDLQPFVPA